MADNFTATDNGAAARKVATDQVTYSGDTADVQIIREVVVTGSEGSKTTIDKAYGAGAVNTGTLRVTLASDDPLVTIANSTTPSPVKLAGQAEYETVAASATDQAMGATGAAGDYLSHLLIVPATTSPGAVSIKDGSGSAITVFTGGASSVSNLVPFSVPLGLVSLSGAWKITTGASVSVIAAGDFS